MMQALAIAMFSLITPSSESLEEAEKNITQRFSAIQSLAATITNEESREQDGKRTSIVVTRQAEWVRKERSFLYRAEASTKVIQSDARGTSTREASSTTISNGEHVVRLTRQDGTTSAIQRKAEVTETPDVRALLERLRQDNTLTRFPDVKVGTQDCYAIQVLPKNQEQSDIRQTMIYFRKDIGVDVRTIVYDKQNQPIFTSTTTDIRVNPSLDPQRFVLTLPDGVELIDQTKP